MFDPSLPFLVISIVAMLILVRAIGAGAPVDLGAIFPHAWELDWPRGVQEEEPQPWRVERLAGPAASSPRRLASTARPACDDVLDMAA